MYYFVMNIQDMFGYIPCAINQIICLFSLNSIHLFFNNLGFQSSVYKLMREEST